LKKNQGQAQHADDSRHAKPRGFDFGEQRAQTDQKQNRTECADQADQVFGPASLNPRDGPAGQVHLRQQIVKVGHGHFRKTQLARFTVVHGQQFAFSDNGPSGCHSISLVLGEVLILLSVHEKLAAVETDAVDDHAVRYHRFGQYGRISISSGEGAEFGPQRRLEFLAQRGGALLGKGDRCTIADGCVGLHHQLPTGQGDQRTGGYGLAGYQSDGGGILDLDERIDHFQG
jgi:hypothetical protein